MARPRKKPVTPRLSGDINPPEGRATIRQSFREREFATALIEAGGNVEKAAALSGIPERTAYHMVKRERVLSRIEQAMADAGIDDAAIADRLQAALYAKKPILVADDEGKPEMRLIDDHPTQLKAVQLIVDTAVKMRQLSGEMPTEVPALPPDLESMETHEIIALAMKRTIRRRG